MFSLSCCLLVVLPCFVSLPLDAVLLGIVVSCVPYGLFGSEIIVGSGVHPFIAIEPISTRDWIGESAG